MVTTGQFLGVSVTFHYCLNPFDSRVFSMNYARLFLELLEFISLKITLIYMEFYSSKHDSEFIPALEIYQVLKLVLCLRGWKLPN